MKYIMFACLLVTFLCAMDHQEPNGELGEDVKSKVPSLMYLSLKIVEENMYKRGWEIVGCEMPIQDAIYREGLFDINPFEKARLVDNFQLKPMFDSTARELASYLDNHDTASERKHALLELVKLSKEMQTLIARYRKN